jgi:hypothetical protein
MPTERPSSILVHGGPWAEHQLRDVAAGLLPGASIEFRNLRWGPIRRDLSRHLADCSTREESRQRAHDAQAQAGIARCRHLRGLPHEAASIRWFALRRLWRDVLNEVKPSAVLSELIDSSVIHALEQECCCRGVPFLGLVGSFVNGYCRVTRFGEHTPIRSPGEAEVGEVLRMLISDSYRPGFVRGSVNWSRTAVVSRWIRQWIRLVWHSSRSLGSSQIIDNHSQGAVFTARDNVHLIPRLRIGDRHWQNRAHAGSGKRCVFVPMQHSPEATIDYWVKDLSSTRYEEALLEWVERLSRNVTVIVKEHPNSLGFRHPRLYRQLAALPNVVLLDTTVPLVEILPACEGVLVWTGSVGFEAALRGCPVACVGAPYYASGSRFLTEVRPRDAERVLQFFQAHRAAPVSTSEQRDMVRWLLSGLVPGRIDFSRVPRPSDSLGYRRIGEQLRPLLAPVQSSGCALHASQAGIQV